MDDTTCKTTRGGVYDASKSESQQPLGAWRLGNEYLGLGSNGDYAMETVSAYDDIRKQETSLTEQLVAGINDTDYYIGYFGLGVNDSSFKDVVASGPIAVLAEKTVIGSQSYGYSAGAYYGASGTPLSLTLGGYDENRFVPHDTLFSLNASSRQPEVVISSITTSISDAEKAPTSWPAASVALTRSDDEPPTALIDSSTPYLWLPSSTCDQFAVAFNLTWNETFGLYLFSDESLEAFRTLPDLSVAFTLSSVSSTNDSEVPTDDQATVTITISANAFIQYLRSPFMDLSSGTPAIPYFPLRRVNDGGKIIIGRTFMQEAYLITNYEANTISVHQATFPDRPFTNTSIKAISPGHNVGPDSQSGSGGGRGLSKEQLAGVVVGASVAGVAIAMLVWWLLRRRKDQGRRTETEGTLKYTDSLAPPGSPEAGSSGFLSTISKSLPWLKSSKGDARGQFTPSPYPVKYGADTSREDYYWTPSPLPELDARRVRSMNGAAEFHPGSGEDMAAYEIARMGLDPLPMDDEYDQPPSTQERFQGNPDMNSTALGARRSSTDLGLHNLFPGSPTPDSFSDGSTSPMSPYGDPRYEWTAHSMPHYPSTQPLVNTQFATVRSNSTLSTNSAEPHSALRSVSSHGSLRPPSPPAPQQRAPIIDGSNVICLGPLPDNVKLPYPTMPAPPLPPPAHRPYGDFFEPPPIPPSINYRRNRVSTAETLGSNYTVEEEAQGRINGPDIVHIPHLPERRYSWEQ